MPLIANSQTGRNDYMTSRDALRGGARTYAQDLLSNQQRNLNQIRGQSAQDASSLASQGVNPFVAQRQAERQRSAAQGQVMGQTQDAIAQRQMQLQAQAEQERQQQQQQALQMLGAGLSTAGSVAAMIPGIGSAVGGGAQALGGAVQGAAGGQAPAGGIGGAVQSLIGAGGGQQAATQRAQPQGLGPQFATFGQGAPGPLPGTTVAPDGANLEFMMGDAPSSTRLFVRPQQVGPDGLTDEERRMRAMQGGF